MRLLNLVQLIFEVFVAIGFASGFIPFLYLISATWVIPLTIVNLILSIVARNRTTRFCVVNVIMAFLATIPVLGIIPRVVGLVIAILSASKLSRRV